MHLRKKSRAFDERVAQPTQITDLGKTNFDFACIFEIQKQRHRIYKSIRFIFMYIQNEKYKKYFYYLFFNLEKWCFDRENQTIRPFCSTNKA